jgi:hypothetical protein
MNKSQAIIKKMGSEIRDNPPKVLSSTRQKFGAERAESQRKAILLNKSRRAGARIPKRRGGR